MIKVQTRLRTPLSRLVDCLWYSDGDVRSHRKERLLPTGRVDLLFKLRDDRTVRIYNNGSEASAQSFGAAVVSGAWSRHFAIDTTQPSPTLGVHFQPGGAAPFLGIPLGELTDRHISLEDLWGRQAVVLREQLMAASSVSSMFQILERALLGRLTEMPGEQSAMLHAVERFSSSATVSVKAVSDSMGYVSKRFIRLFRDSVGLTPKQFCRIQRFQAVLDRIAGGEPVEWVNVALDNGYYDQSHLIRDFREFAGVTPREYQPVEPGRKNHMALDSQADNFFQYGGSRSR